MFKQADAVIAALLAAGADRCGDAVRPCDRRHVWASGPLLLMKPLALYDADCGFCTRWIGVVQRRVPGVAVASLNHVDLAALGVDPGRTELEMPLVRPDGSVVLRAPSVGRHPARGAARPAGWASYSDRACFSDPPGASTPGSPGTGIASPAERPPAR